MDYSHYHMNDSHFLNYVLLNTLVKKPILKKNAATLLSLFLSSSIFPLFFNSRAKLILELFEFIGRFCSFEGNARKLLIFLFFILANVFQLLAFVLLIR